MNIEEAYCLLTFIKAVPFYDGSTRSGAPPISRGRTRAPIKNRSRLRRCSSNLSIRSGTEESATSQVRFTTTARVITTRREPRSRSGQLQSPCSNRAASGLYIMRCKWTCGGCLLGHIQARLSNRFIELLKFDGGCHGRSRDS